MKEELKGTLQAIKECYMALEDRKAMDIKILKVAGKSSITDYFVIATGNSLPHVKALRNALEKRLKELRVGRIKIDYQPQSGWAVIDGFDFMVHLFIEEARAFYDLEALWKDAEIIDIEGL